jgi:hypothetical protein
MATTTPNFGWAVPTSTDLVKDGAVAIETLGDAIDASLVDLKGGTSGQVLAKASNTDMDFSWVTDATGIPATILDAKGDIIAATAADTASRLAVGANDTVLTADSTTATGLKWAAVSGGSVTYTTWSPSFTNFTLGNGTLVARYGTSGKFVTFNIGIQLGSTSSVSGGITFSLPKTPKNTTLDLDQFVFTAFLEGGVDIFYGATELGTTNGVVYAMLANGTYVSRTGTSATVPFTWGNTDVIQITGVYEEA